MQSIRPGFKHQCEHTSSVDRRSSKQVLQNKAENSTFLVMLLGRHGSVSLCRVERENKMAATYNVLAFKR